MGVGVVLGDASAVVVHEAEIELSSSVPLLGGLAPPSHRLGVVLGEGFADVVHLAENVLGCGVPQDYAKAVGWRRKAAEQGHAEGQVNLGTMYGLGQGVPQDYAQAHMWFNLAASKFPPGEDHDDAVKNRDIVAIWMTPAQISEAKKLAREWRPKK